MNVLVFGTQERNNLLGMDDADKPFVVVEDRE